MRVSKGDVEAVAWVVDAVREKIAATEWAGREVVRQSVLRVVDVMEVLRDGMAAQRGLALTLRELSRTGDEDGG